MGCRDAGWNAIPEAAGPGWKADVLATSTEAGRMVTLAFEIQWSRQSYPRTWARQMDYEDAGVKGIWFFKCLPVSLEEEANDIVPAFQIVFDKRLPFISFGFGRTPLQEFVRDYLHKKVRLRTTSRFKRTMTVEIEERICDSCRTISHIISKSGWIEASDCGHTFNHGIGNTECRIIDDWERDPDAEAIRTAWAAQESTRLRQCSFLEYPTMTYLTCPGCRRYTGLTTQKKMNLHLSQKEEFTRGQFVHWCYSPTMKFCEGE
jgi:hypothetical protein